MDEEAFLKEMSNPIFVISGIAADRMLDDAVSTLYRMGIPTFVVITALDLRTRAYKEAFLHRTEKEGGEETEHAKELLAFIEKRNQEIAIANRGKYDSNDSLLNMVKTMRDNTKAENVPEPRPEVR